MIYKIPYTDDQPFLRVFLDMDNHVSQKTFPVLARVDTGAHSSVISYEDGLKLGFRSPTEPEFKSLFGVGGSINHVKRECYLFLAKNDKTGGFFRFKEIVDWLHPDQKTQAEMARLDEKFKISVGAQKNEALKERNQLLSAYQVGTLIGRPFFNNLKYITFVHPNTGEKYFTFELKGIL